MVNSILNEILAIKIVPNQTNKEINQAGLEELDGIVLKNSI